MPMRTAAGSAGLAALLMAAPALAQDSGYLLPPDPIPQILDAPRAPLVSVSGDGRTLALLERANMPGIADLSEPELRLAGWRINPVTNGPSATRVTYSDGIVFQDVETGARRPVPLPAGTRVGYARWSPDDARVAFLSPTPAGMELWVAEAATGRARRLTGPVVNAAFGSSAFQWAPDARSLVIARVPADRGAAPVASPVPTGPLVQETSGRAAPVRTFQDLLSSPHEERLFEHYFTSQLARVGVGGGAPAPLGQPGIVTSFSPSPDGRFLLVTRLKRPFSYVLPSSRFPTEVQVLDARGRPVHTVADLPTADQVPAVSDAVRTGPRSVQWRADAPATLVWVEAQDGGDPRAEAAVRDRVVMLDAPFTAAPRALAELEQRYWGITWGRDDVALLSSGWDRTRRTRTYVVDPSRPGAAPRLLVERGTDDRYAHPGSPLLVPNGAGRSVLAFTPDGGAVFVSGQGASPRGSYPFFGRMSLATGETERTWQAADPHYEVVVDLLARDGGRILTRRESQTEPPNYHVRSLADGSTRPVTDFPDPAPQLAGMQRQLVTYARADGVPLSGTLYLPAGYDAARDGRLPVVMWAYPREFRDAGSAGQVDDSPNRFSRPGGASHLLLLTQGYAIFDDPAMPIIGEEGREPNDTFVEQLVAGARAAVDKVVEMGVGDRDRIAVGGHSYGAFMTAHLLAHTDLFRAGIARSGAYNRTLTPFGFQNEDRSYWEATDTYTTLSPFTHAHKVDEPILLIHGADDNNSGTFPMQSERFYAALKGNGATVRYVVLPKETHGYRARESVMHTLAEMTAWLDAHVKNAGPRAAEATAGR